MRKNSSIKIEVLDPDTGEKVTVVFDGGIPKSISESIGKYLSDVLSSHVPHRKGRREERETSQTELSELGGFSTTFGKFKFLLMKHFQYGSFTSHDVQDEFDRVFGERLRGSTVSTYLLRLSNPVNGIAERRPAVGGYEYRLRGEKVKSEVVEAEKARPSRNSSKQKLPTGNT